MGNYSKLIGGIVGSLVGMLFAYLAVKGLATCVPGPDGTQACSLWGISDSQITAGVVALVANLLVWAFPKNQTS